jgi:hypothetical protein
MRGRRPSRRALIAGVAVLAVLIGAGAAALVAASGDDDPGSVASGTSPTFTGRTETGSSSTATSTTPPRTATEEGTTTGGGQTTSRTETTPPTPPAAPAEPPSSPGDSAAKHKLVKVPPARVLTGTGTKWLGTIDVSRPALVRWSGHGKLSIRFGRERFPVVAPSSTGQLAVPPYRFELVRVISKGSWQIKITPQG